LITAVSKLKLRFGDWLRNSALVWKLHAFCLAIRSLGQHKIEVRLLTLSYAYRRWPTAWLQSRLSPWLTPDRGAIWREKNIGWERYQQRLNDHGLIKSILLKAPHPWGEKGVLYVAFEYNWLRLLKHHDIRKLMQDYLIVGASSCSPPDFSAHWALAHVGPDPVFMQISNSSDMLLYGRFNHNIRPIPIMASDWINPAFYQPKPHSQRGIDLLVVAGWGRVKRHWTLFNALKKMRKGLRVVLIGQDMDGRTAADVLNEARVFGVANRIEMICDARIEDVARHQCDSKASVILSAREGACVVVSESLFADAPVALFHDAHIGSSRYINEETGIFLHRETMAAQLESLIDESDKFSPRRWAEVNINCSQTSGRLNQLLRDYSASVCIPWTCDITPICWHPDPEYMSPVDRSAMTSSYSDLMERHNLSISPYT